MKRLFFLFPVFIFLFSAAHNPSFASVIKQGDVQKEALDDIKKTVEAFNQIMIQDMNIRLPKEVSVYVTPDTNAYEQVLIKKFKIPRAEAKQWADNSSGFSTDLGVVLNTSRWAMEKTHDRYNTTAHELFHQLQHSLLGERWKQDPRWMREGTCYYVSTHVVERLGFKNTKSWRRSQINSTLNRTDLATTEEVIGADRSERWLALSEQKKSPHKMAVLLVLTLLDLSQKNPYQSIADYYTGIGRGKNFREAFKEAFDLDYDQFLQDFTRLHAERMTRQGEIDLVPDARTPLIAAEELKKTFETSQLFFKEEWGAPLKISPCILLASDQSSSLNIFQKEFGFAPPEVTKENEKNIFPFYLADDTALLSLGNPGTTDEPLSFLVASILARMYGNENASQPDLEGETWLFYGASDLAAAMISEKNGSKSLKEWKETWLERIRPLPAFPRLHQLQTAEEFRKASQKIGRPNASAFIALAALYLSERNGMGSLAECYRKEKEYKNPHKAFEKVFGLTLEKFEQEFRAYLEQQRKEP